MAVETKFCVAWIVLSAVFILLSATEPASVSETQKEGHRCYWCGPLAEQVHRSDRASKCNGDRSKITVCDEDAPYCAIAATFLPYIESRYCLKEYEDACYTVYCDTTKTWKMICPCRGELCNGVKTQRNNDALASFQRHVAELTQKKWSKRALVTKAEFIGMTTRKNTVENTTTDEEKDIEKVAPSENIVTDDDLKNNESNTIGIDMNGSTSVVEAEETTQMADTVVVEGTESVATIPTEAKMEVPTESPEMTSSETKPNDISSEIPATVATESKSAEIPVNNTMIQIDITNADIDSGDLKTDIEVMSSQPPKLSDDKPTDMVTKIIENISKVLTTTTPETKPTTVEIKIKPETTTEMVKTTQAEAKIDKTKPKSNEKLPAAEALQHNDTPTTKMTELTPTSTATMTMTTPVPTHATMPRNNTAVRINAHILPIVIGVLLLK